MSKKLFISHSHQDVFYAEQLIEVLEKIGLESEKIFCSSVEGYGVPLGEDFLIEIKKWLNEEVVVIFLLSKEYYKSPISLCEMGASWITAKKVFPILIPPLTVNEFTGVFNRNIGFNINDSFKLTLFKERIETLFEIDTKLSTIHWEKFKTKILESLEAKICAEKNIVLISDSDKINDVKNIQLIKDSFNIGYSYLMIINEPSRATWRNILQELCNNFEINISIDETDLPIVEKTIQGVSGKIFIRYGEEIVKYLQIAFETIGLMASVQQGRKENIDEYVAMLNNIDELKDKEEYFRNLWNNITYDRDGVQNMLNWLNEMKETIEKI